MQYDVNIFEEIKQRLAMREVVNFYGFTPNRSNMICCPFHDEKTPSMRIYDTHFHCFGCGEHGDSIKFVQLLYNLSPIESAKKLNSDFGLGIQTERQPTITIGKPQEREPTQSELQKAFEQWEQYTHKILLKYYKLLRIWYEEFAPRSVDEVPYELFTRSCMEKEQVFYWLNVLAVGTDEEKITLFKNKEYLNFIETEVKKYYES